MSSEEPSLREVTMNTLIRKAIFARNTSVTYGGKTPYEIAYGRKPPDVISLENMSARQYSMEPTASERTDDMIRDLAQKAHLEARQRVDIRRDHGPAYQTI